MNFIAKLSYNDKIESEASDCSIYLNSVDFSDEINLEKQEKKARENFFPYLKGEKEYEKLFMENDDFVAFKGYGESSGLFFHMIIVPKLKHAYDKENDKILLMSVKDINESHKELLNKMKNETFKFVKRNSIWFNKNYRFKDTGKWLKNENIQFGFHYPPSIGYLHMHVVIGPLTTHGAELADRWVKLENIF